MGTASPAMTNESELLATDPVTIARVRVSWPARRRVHRRGLRISNGLSASSHQRSPRHRDTRSVRLTTASEGVASWYANLGVPHDAQVSTHHSQRPPARARSRIQRGRSVVINPLAVAAGAATCGIALGAFLAYFLDPNSGRRRRHTGRDRALSRLRRGERRAAGRARRAESHAVGIAQRTFNAARRTRREPFDDVALARKVESELYRRARVPKGTSASTQRMGSYSCAGSWSGRRTSSASRPRRGRSQAFARWRI